MIIAPPGEKGLHRYVAGVKENKRSLQDLFVLSCGVLEASLSVILGLFKVFAGLKSWTLKNLYQIMGLYKPVKMLLLYYFYLYMEHSS